MNFNVVSYTGAHGDSARLNAFLLRSMCLVWTIIIALSCFTKTACADAPELLVTAKDPEQIDIGFDGTTYTITAYHTSPQTIGAFNNNVYYVLVVPRPCQRWKNRVFGKDGFVNDGRICDSVELWTTNGHAGGNTPVATIAGYPIHSSDPIYGGYWGQILLGEYINTNYGITSSVQANGLLFFNFDNKFQGPQLWVTDGNPNNTHIVLDLGGGTTGSMPDNLVAVGNTVFFVANNGTNGRELWRTDGTSGGTSMMTDIRPGSAGSMPSLLTAIGSRLYFVANDGVHGNELWVSDGTAGGTHLVKDITPGAGSTIVNEITAVQDTLYLSLQTESTITTVQTNTAGVKVLRELRRHQLWKSDGTEIGTVLLQDASSISSPMSTMHPTAFDNRLLFFTPMNNEHLDLLTSDGSATGTTALAEFVANDGTSLSSIYNAAGQAYFLQGQILFQTKGLPENTRRAPKVVRVSSIAGVANNTIGLVSLWPTTVYSAEEQTDVIVWHRGLTRWDPHEPAPFMAGTDQQFGADQFQSLTYNSLLPINNRFVVTVSDFFSGERSLWAFTDDQCPNNINKKIAGDCGCDVADIDSDKDGTSDCIDTCPSDPEKIAPGICGCGLVDNDSDNDGTYDCVDSCPTDPLKTTPGICGCGLKDVDANKNKITDCLEAAVTNVIPPAPSVVTKNKPIRVRMTPYTGTKYYNLKWEESYSSGGRSIKSTGTMKSPTNTLSLKSYRPGATIKASYRYLINYQVNGTSIYSKWSPWRTAKVPK